MNGILSEKVKKHLSVDPVMQKLIKKHDLAPIVQNFSGSKLFCDIIESIISQQLSVKAADTIFKRFLFLFGNKFPILKQILSKSDDDIRSCGISYSKIKYIKGVAQAVLDKKIDLDNLHNLTDEEVINVLVALKGIGRWTTEMLLIFSLAREDIFSLGDIGLRNAVSRLYNVDRDDLKGIEKISRSWSPYRSLASRYLWRSLDNE